MVDGRTIVPAVQNVDKTYSTGNKSERTVLPDCRTDLVW